jgi:hypothetical protein
VTASTVNNQRSFQADAVALAIAEYA